MDALTISSKLYGRDRDIVALLASLERISSGAGEVLLVPGSSGVGKTALVQELQGPIRDRNGFFIQGKFEQYQQNVPYFAFRQALAELCREMQAGDALQRARFQAEILEAVGSLGQVLVDLVPEFAAFLGPQPPLEEISAQEARHRFTDVCRSFLKVVCLPEHPLVLFLDDWQWADAASCALLRQLQVGTTLRYLLVIVSYRDNEVRAGHPLMSAIADLRSSAVPVEVLPVENITAADVQELVADMLQPAADDVAGLAALIHGKTQGTPFFVRSFLDLLLEFQLVWLDEAHHRWRWRIDKVGGADLPVNVVDLFVLKLRRLDADSQELFSLASCLGNRFDLETLGIISERDPHKCLAQLASGNAGRLIRPLDGGGTIRRTEMAGAPKSYVFLHDRVQQAAYSLIAPAERPGILLKIGRLLLARLHPDQLAERLFEIVSDLNAGRQLVHDTAELMKLVELNIDAARKAYAAIAYHSALQFYRAASDVAEAPGLAVSLWRDRHELMMQLLTERAECEFLEGSRAEAEDCIRQAVARARTAIEKAVAINVLIVQYTLLARYPEAIAAGRAALAALGIHLPVEGFEEARNAEIAQVRRELGDRPVASLAQLPVMSDPEMIVASQILITMGPPCYRSHQRLWGVIVPKVVNLTLRHGNIPQVGYSHTAFGGLLGWVDGDFAMAREFGELATRLMTSTFRTPSHQSVFYLMIGSSTRHWFRHLKYGTQDYADAYEIGLRSGNLQYAAYAFGHDMYCRFYQGVPLAELMLETQRSLEFSRIHLNQWAIDLLDGGRHIFCLLSSGQPATSPNEVWSEGEFLQRVEVHQNIQVTCIYQVLKTCALLVSGDHEAALALSDDTEPLIYTVGTQGLLPWPEHVFARILILTALHGTADPARQSASRTELDQLMGRLRIWSDNCAENFEHKYLLASAELARIDGRPDDAMPLYDRAVKAAQAGNFLQWEGMANERACGFWLAQGNERLAHVYWQQAYVCYDRWGAGAKVRSMETSYRAYLAEHLPAHDGSGTAAGVVLREGGDALVARQIELLRNYASQMQQTRLRVEATARAEDLTHAMHRVRVEIAERRRTEDALRESEHMLQESQVIASLGSYVLDISAGSWRSSHVLDTLLGIDEAYVHSLDGWAALIHPDDRDMMVDYLRREVIGLRRAFDREYRIVRHDDQSERWMHVLGKLEFDAEGRAVTLRGTLQDITARRRTEQSLRLQSAALNAAADAIAITDPAGVIEWINPAFTKLTGYSTEEALGKRHRDLVNSGKQTRAFFGELWEAILAGRTWRGEIINRRKDGGLYSADQVVTPILNAAGVITHFVAIQHDLTERLQLEAQFRQAQKMETVGQLASGIAHDFNNLLTVINGTSALLLAQVSQDDLMHADVREILHAGERAATLTRQLLAFSRQQILEPRVLKFNTVVAGIESLLRRLLGEDIDLVIVPTPGVGSVKVDPGQIEQVITNLAVNARDAMPQGGQLTIETQSVTIDEAYARQPGEEVPPGSYVRLAVSDSGVGMDAATRAHIFEPFFTTKGLGKGTGLGLSTVYGIVQQTQGFISVQSEVGQGTRFTIFLPQVTEAAGTDRPAPTGVSTSGTETILVAEDSAGLRKFVTRLLKPAGYTVLKAASGEEALRLLERHEEPVHLLLSDVVMPGMSGRELADQLARTRPGMKVLYMSGYTDDAIMRHGVLEAKVSFLNKPFTEAALLQKVREVLDADALPPPDEPEHGE